MEYQRLWPKTWQMVCREEELPKVGDFVTYEIGHQSFIVVRGRDRIRSTIKAVDVRAAAIWEAALCFNRSLPAP